MTESTFTTIALWCNILTDPRALYAESIITTSEDSMNNRSKREHDPALYNAILTLQTPEECIAFLEDLCTMNELMAMEQRYQVAKHLYDGKIYNEILAETGASSATISRVNRSLQYGNGGYEMVFERMKADHE